MSQRNTSAVGWLLAALSMTLIAPGCDKYGCPRGYEERMGRCLSIDGGVDGSIADAAIDGGTEEDAAVPMDAQMPIDAQVPIDAGMAIADGGSACVPSADICNSLDDDCDGLIDEHLASWSDAIPLAGARPDEARLDASGDGNFILTYRTYDFATALGTLHVQQIGTDGMPIGTPATLAGNAETFASSSDGDNVLITVRDGTTLRATVAIASPRGVAVSALTPVATTLTNRDQVRGVISHDFALFVVQSGTSISVISRSFPSLGGTSAPMEVAVGANNFDVGQVASDGLGAVVVYASRDADHAIWMRVLGQDGIPVAEATQILDPTSGIYLISPSVGARPLDDAGAHELLLHYCAYPSSSSCGREGSEYRVSAVRINADGSGHLEADRTFRPVTTSASVVTSRVAITTLGREWLLSDMIDYSTTSTVTRHEFHSIVVDGAEMAVTTDIIAAVTGYWGAIGADPRGVLVFVPQGVLRDSPFYVRSCW